MTLEDFFTLAEMKDGLTAPSRVEELVTVMRKEKDSFVKNVGDATRQWAAVASTIAATENQDCLDLFINLDGLWFIDRWLIDVQKFGNDTSDSFVEESITALLRALEKLLADNERSISSGIWYSVKNLLSHNNSRVQDRARALFDNWKQVRDNDAVHKDVEKVGTVNISFFGESVNDRTRVPAGGEILPSRRSDGLQPERIENVQIETQNNQLRSPNRADMEVKSLDPLASSVVSNSLLENLPIKEEMPVCGTDGTTSIESCNSPISKQENVGGQSDVLKLNEFNVNEKLMHKVSSSPDKLGAELSSASSTLELRAVSSGPSPANGKEFVNEPGSQIKADRTDGDLDKKITASGDAMTLDSEPKSGMDDIRALNHSSIQELQVAGQAGTCCSDTLQDSSSNECLSGKPEDQETSFSRMEDIEAANEDKELTSDRYDNLTNGSSFLILAKDTKSPDVCGKSWSNPELEDGTVDAIEVARQVAQDYREPFCSSSSDKISEGGIMQPGSPDSINGKEGPIKIPPKEVPTGQNHSAEAYPEGEGLLNNSENADIKPENCINDMESSQLTEAVQEPDVNTEKGLCDFDLNQEVCSDDMDCSVNLVSAPISVVSASRPAAALGWPIAPLQFEGTLGWKGSAATSAFRPASPRRTPDGDKTLSAGGTCNSSKQRQDCLDIDLNMAEDGDDKPADIASGKEIPISCGLPSGESSVEVSPRRSGRPKLDLNLISDDSDAPLSNPRNDGRLFHHRNFPRSPSPASSSSSKQPFIRNFDLNDRPSFHNDSSDLGPYHGKFFQNINAYGESKTDDPVISIFGTRVEVNRKDFVPGNLSLLNGKAPELAMDANVVRSGGVLGMVPTVSYTSPVFGYNGLTTGPTMSIYGTGGSIPYMVGPRGNPVMPQMMGSATGVPPSYPQPPFIMSMTSTPPGLNGAGPSRPNFDLNSRFVIDGGNRDPGVLRQLFVPSQVRPMEEHLRPNSQPSSSSGAGGKRKEPDGGGWDTSPFNYKFQQPPWK